MSRRVVQREAADGDRISQLPMEILDHIMGLLPIQEAARTAVLSKVWRDAWLSLTQCCFDNHFFSYFEEKNQWGRKYVGKSPCLYVINDILLKHRGSIKKFVCHSWAVTKPIRPGTLNMDRWLWSLKEQGVEEIHLHSVDNIKYSLPDFMFSCSTLRRLRLYWFYIGPQSSPCTLPEVTSLCFEFGDFGTGDHSNYVIDVPKLENLAFIYCRDIFHFNITARNLYSLTIKGCPGKPGNFLPVNLDLSSIRVLDIDNDTLRKFLGQYTSKGLSLQPPALNLEQLKLSDFCFHDDARISAFLCLLCKCPNLLNLEIEFKTECDIYYRIDATSGNLEKLRGVAETRKMLSSLKISSFKGLKLQMLFIKEMLASLPALEKVVIICSASPYRFDWKRQYDIWDEILHFPRASAKADIVYL